MTTCSVVTSTTLGCTFAATVAAVVSALAAVPAVPPSEEGAVCRMMGFELRATEAPA